MSRTLGALLAVLAMLVLCGASASASSQEGAGYTYTSIAIPGTNHTVRYWVQFSGTGVKTIRLYFIGFTDKLNRGTKVVSVPSKYLTLVKSKKYWVLKNPPRNYTPKYGVIISVRVRGSIPLRSQHCVLIRSVGENPATGFREEWPVGRGYCMTGGQWLATSAN